MPKGRAGCWWGSIPCGPSPVLRSFPLSEDQGETQGWGTLPPPETRLGVQQTPNQYHWICLKMINTYIELAPRPGDVQIPGCARRTPSKDLLAPWKGRTWRLERGRKDLGVLKLWLLLFSL